MEKELIESFVGSEAVSALDSILNTDNINETSKATVTVSNAFGASGFDKIAVPDSDAEEKLISSFNNNLVLLIQKTWVEKSDEALKAAVLYQLEEFSKNLSDKKYNEAYTSFFNIVDSVVYLMFGSQAKTKEFDEYALRIDPEFGIFWWYFKNLPRTNEWAAEKVRLTLLLGMFFLANY